MRTLFGSLILAFTLGGCADMMGQRTYLSEMENDDSQFFNPNQDFPVLAGDTGRSWNTKRQMRERTPASVHDVELSQEKKSLNRELAALEAGQSENALNFYEDHKHKLKSTSERIYFLKLPHNERNDYLISRGFMGDSRQNVTPTEKALSRRERDILLGMTKNDVMDSYGKPLRVDVAGNPNYENERWAYQMNGSTKYIYFESGQVQGWE